MVTPDNNLLGITIHVYLPNKTGAHQLKKHILSKNDNNEIRCYKKQKNFV